MLSNDTTRIEILTYFIPYLVVGPIETAVITYLLATTIDVSILFGLVIIIVAIPVQTILGKLLDGLR